MRRVIIMILSVLLGFQAYSLEVGRDSLTVSLITCAPGSEIYELCGHEAVRIRSARMDSVWNYGTFDFNEPNFVYRFVKGETDYMLSSYPFSLFMPEYVYAGREVTEQELNLTQEEAWRLLGLLREEAKPENRKYRYNYVKDNCATRILDRLDQAGGNRIVYPDTIRYGTFRDEMRSFHKDYPWYQFGIDLALGGGLDYDLRSREEMFVPVVMKEKVAGAHFADGRPLVRTTRILFEGRPGATLPPTPWYLTPFFFSGLAFFLAIGICLLQGWKKRIYRWIYTLWFGICGLGGCLVLFLVVISQHEATSPNLLLVWLNPLQLLPAICVWFRRLRYGTAAIAWFDVVALSCMLLVWPFQQQSANPAFFPLIGTTLALAATYLLVSSQNNYKVENEKNSNIGTGRTRDNEFGGKRRSVKTKTGGRNRR